MKKERVLITGCGGMLGAAVYPYFSERFETVLATDIDLNEDWLQKLSTTSDRLHRRQTRTRLSRCMEQRAAQPVRHGGDGLHRRWLHARNTTWPTDWRVPDA